MDGRENGRVGEKRGRKPKRTDEEYTAFKVKVGVYYLRGRSMHSIAARVEESYSYVRTAIHAFLADVDIPNEDRAVRAAFARYDQLYEELWKRIPNAADKDAAALIARATQIEKDRMALLGFAKPTRISIAKEDAKDMMDAELAELIAEERARQLAEEAQQNARRNARRNGRS